MNMPRRTKKSTQDQERVLFNEIDQNIQYCADALRGTNNIGESWGVNNICDMFGDTYVLMEMN